MEDKIIMYGTDWCGDCHRSRRFLDRHQIEYIWINVDEDPEALEKIKALNNGMRRVPTIIFPSGDILMEPSDYELSLKTGVKR